MNVRMWEHPSTKENLHKLKGYGYKIIGPEIGDMACGEFGEGKMTEPEQILKNINDYFSNLNTNKKFKALVTAGPTYEYIDPVRFITNKSSGKQGFELAKSLSKQGFETTLISGPTNLKVDNNIKLITSHRSGESIDSQISHIGIGTNSRMLKVGVVGGERIAKLNELIRLSEHDLIQGMAEV